MKIRSFVGRDLYTLLFWPLPTELVYTLILFFTLLHSGVMKSPVNLAALAVVIFCCVHAGVAGKH